MAILREISYSGASSCASSMDVTSSGGCENCDVNMMAAIYKRQGRLLKDPAHHSGRGESINQQQDGARCQLIAVQYEEKTWGGGWDG